MADEISIQTKLYAAKGGAYLPSVTRSITLDMTGADMGSWTQVIGTGSDEALDIPPDVTGDIHVEVFSLESEGGNYVQLSNATGGSFSGGVFAKLIASTSAIFVIPSGTTIYAQANTASVSVQVRACEV
jgi:hypothetical protein